MSAFLFVQSDKAIKEAATEKLMEYLTYHEKIVAAVDWSKFKMCTFEYDQASGSKASIIKIEAELKQRKIGIDEPLPRLIVPGFNPPDVYDLPLSGAHPIYVKTPSKGNLKRAKTIIREMSKKVKNNE